MDYMRVDTEESGDAELNAVEQKELLYSIKGRKTLVYESRWCLAAKIFTGLNLCLAAFLTMKLVLFRPNPNCVPGPSPPWSPVREDGIIRNVNKRYKPDKIFQSETSDEVEEAWEGWLTEYDHLIILPTDQTESRLPITVDAFLDPGYSVYGLAVYHQMHCLNHIRKTFYGDKFFQDKSKEMVQFHKNHCFDMLRQSIMCHADISMLHWWNDTYSYVDDTGAHKLTDHYFSLTPSQRAEGSFAKWDSAVQCRDLNAINIWAEAHSMEDDKYAATVGIPKRHISGRKG